MNLWRVLARWFVRHVVQRLYAPSIIDRKKQIAADRLDDNRALMNQVMSRIGMFKGYSAELRDVHVDRTPDNYLRLTFPVNKRILDVRQAEAVPLMIETRIETREVQDYHAITSLALYRPEDYPEYNVRLATAVILIDQLSRHVARESERALLEASKTRQVS